MSTTADKSWYHDAIIYEAHVRAFRDENGDGIGDFRGLTSKLDYLRDLGVTALWLLPFYPSPLRDDGYDIADYRAIHPDYGSMADFKRFLRQAHARELRVITELVINHTSDQHPWFQRARRATAGSSERDFYVWTDDPELYKDARIIFQDTETSNWAWDPEAGAYYWHRFFSHQPDLNFENPAVHEAVFETLEFWLDIGVDGLRLDAVPYLYERDGTMCENLPETHGFLKELRARVDARYDDRVLLAEANQWPEDSAAYFGEGNECHMAFHFPLMPRLFMSTRMENRFPIVDILEQTPPIPESAAWAIFLRNHDELTLEMVTDEERDYMYRVFAGDPQQRINVGIRRRLAPLLANNRREIELMKRLLLSLPGTPVLYYGDEIGMGDNVYLGDRNGVRTPMQWSSDRNAGFSEANPQQLYLPVITDPEYHYESVNVEIQRANPNSLWWFTRRTLAQRKRLPELSRGTFEVVPCENAKVLAFLRRLEERSVLVIANLSRHVQPVTLDLSAFVGSHPVEVLGATRFPTIGEGAYTIAIGPRDCYWFTLESAVSEVVGDQRPQITLRGPLESIYRARTQLQRSLVADIVSRRWYRSKTSTIREGALVDVIEMPGTDARLAVLRLEYADADTEVYAIPLSLASGLAAERVLEESPEAVIAEVTSDEGPATLYDGMYDESFARSLLALVSGRKRAKGRSVSMAAGPIPGARRLTDLVGESTVRSGGMEQSNSSVIFGEELILKLFRKIEAGPNPEVEVGRFLTEKAGLSSVPAARGLLEITIDEGPAALAFVQDFVPSAGNAFDLTCDNATQALEQIVGRIDELGLPPRSRHPLEVTPAEMAVGRETIPQLLSDAELLGRRTAEMHLALASSPADPVFAPERLSTLQQRSLYQAIRSSVRGSVSLLRRMIPRLLPQDVELARRVVSSEAQLLEHLKAITSEKIEGVKIRTHGDFHLGQVLNTGIDFVIIDFEGEPQRPLSSRRLKRLALGDVAGMIRSYHYAIVMAHQQLLVSGLEEDGREAVTDWAHAMHRWVSASFLDGYVETLGDSPLVPSNPKHFRLLLDALLVQKAAYELEYELNNRPDWVQIPLQGILETIG